MYFDAPNFILAHDSKCVKYTSPVFLIRYGQVIPLECDRVNAYDRHKLQEMQCWCQKFSDGGAMFPDGGGGAIFFFMVRHGRLNFCQFSLTNVAINFPRRGGG